MATLDLTASTMLACPLPQHPCRHQDAWKSIFKVTVAEPQRRVPLANTASSLLVWVSTGLKSYFFFTQLSRTSAYKMNLIIKFLSKVMWCRAHLKPTSQSCFLLWPVHALHTNQTKHHSNLDWWSCSLQSPSRLFHHCPHVLCPSTLGALSQPSRKPPRDSKPLSKRWSEAAIIALAALLLFCVKVTEGGLVLQVEMPISWLQR